MTSHRSPLALVVLVGVTITATGCGYSTRRPFPGGIETVHVKTFHSREFRRDLEFQLTEALVKRINLDTPYKIAPLRSADTVLTGEILVAYRWKDLRSGEVLVEHERFVYTTTYIPPVGETFATGMVRGMDGLAEAIVETMESPW